MPQLKFIVDEELLRKFKQIVLAKHGKIELKPEGEDAIKLYIKKYEQLVEPRVDGDPLSRVIGAVKMRKRSNALSDLKRLDSGTL